MYRFEILENVDPKTWNNNLKKSEYATFFQTAEYVNSQSTIRNGKPLFISVINNGKIEGQLGLVIIESAKASSSPLIEAGLTIFSGLGRRASWAGGPIIHDNDKKSRIKILQKILEALEKVLKEKKVILLDGYTPHQDFLIDQDYKNEFNINEFKIRDFFTFATDLNCSLDEIWKNVHKSTQRDINRAKKRGIIIKELSTLKELDEYFELSKKWGKTKGINSKLSNQYRQKYWDCIKSGVEKIFLAFEDNELVSSHRLGCFNNIAFSHKLTNSYSKPTSLGGPLLTWHAIEWAKKAGMKIYDFSGGESPPVDQRNKKKYEEQWGNLLSYKKKWGGKEYSYFHLIKVRRKGSYKIFRILSKPDTMFRNFKKKQFKRPQKQIRRKN